MCLWHSVRFLGARNAFSKRACIQVSDGLQHRPLPTYGKVTRCARPPPRFDSHGRGSARLRPLRKGLQTQRRKTSYFLGRLAPYRDCLLYTSFNLQISPSLKTPYDFFLPYQTIRQDVDFADYFLLYLDDTGYQLGIILSLIHISFNDGFPISYPFQMCVYQSNGGNA